MNPVPENFDWAAAVVACSPKLVFDEIAQLAESAVATRNEARTTDERQDRVLMEYVRDDPASPQFLVACERKRHYVHFNLRNGAIEIARAVGRDHVVDRQLRVIAKVNTIGECRLQFDGAGPELTKWQVVRQAIEDTLFGPIPD